jgi:pimeloyl-ACP methyl ester carboxylesterase
MARSVRKTLHSAAETVSHSLGYARHLLRGNRVAGDLSWVQPGTRPVVLVHGFLGTRGTMMPLTRRFQADGRVVFSYHHGTFQLGSLRDSAEELTQKIRELVDNLELDRVDVLGFSMGGLVALHAVKFLQGQRWIRRLVMLGTPLAGSWLTLAAIPTIGMLSSSVWQVRPGCKFLEELRSAPLPAGVRLRQIHADADAFCRNPGPVEGVDPEHDYMVLPGGHASLVVAQHFYAAAREFLDETDEAEIEVTPPR